MNPDALLKDLHGRGVELWNDGGRLMFRSAPGALTPELRTVIVHHKPQVLARLDAEVEWRIEAFAAQVPAVGAIPFLLARADARCGQGLCLSCGDPTTAPRCALCAQAARRVSDQLGDRALRP